MNEVVSGIIMLVNPDNNMKASILLPDLDVDSDLKEKMSWKIGRVAPGFVRLYSRDSYAVEILLKNSYIHRLCMELGCYVFYESRFCSR